LLAATGAGCRTRLSAVLPGKNTKKPQASVACQFGDSLASTVIPAESLSVSKGGNPPPQPPQGKLVRLAEVLAPLNCRLPLFSVTACFQGPVGEARDIFDKLVFHCAGETGSEKMTGSLGAV
jgi:hypothetical protein